ncbi:hypothetical protein AXE65_07170 [Ventosimonas gracilis]|uniref:Lipoprotein n=1 Tax=Ventosimonas gracilis TaxID=1680762 RepID=A0A139SJA1_9GAMM|nr:hypothetical protein [Ventosimonas gracilis]KXU34613.1 hypothetical protein AXE65_07170 [Ventosimonas gracilis]
MRTIAIVLASWALAGCVHEADYGKIERSGSGLFLKQLTVIREGDYQHDNFLPCVRRYARYYSAPKDKREVLQYDNGRTLQLTGNTRWRFAFVDRFMRFQLTAQRYNRRFYTFEEISSGELLLFNRGAVWPLAARGIEGKRALQALLDVVDSIEQCQRDLDKR